MDRYACHHHGLSDRATAVRFACQCSFWAGVLLLRDVRLLPGEANEDPETLGTVRAGYGSAGWNRSRGMVSLVSHIHRVRAQHIVDLLPGTMQNNYNCSVATEQL